MSFHTDHITEKDSDQQSIKPTLTLPSVVTSRSLSLASPTRLSPNSFTASSSSYFALKSPLQNCPNNSSSNTNLAAASRLSASFSDASEKMSVSNDIVITSSLYQHQLYPQHHQQNQQQNLLQHQQQPEIPSIPGYSTLVPIYPHYDSSISMYRSTRTATNKPVLVKVSTRGSLEDLTRIRHEWSVVFPLQEEEEKNNKKEGLVFPSLNNIKGILRPDSCMRLGSSANIVVLTFPDRNLVTLREKYINSSISKVDDYNSSSPASIARSPSELNDIIKIIISVLRTLEQVHSRNITHNGLTSSAILTNNHNETFLSGWDFSFPLKAEDTSRGYRKTHLTQIADYLGYVSPENTGLTNRLVDFRSDFYSIGCILYELVVGYLPFRSIDPSELSRMQVLRNPVSPSTLGPWIPEALSAIIMKLLEKNADDRYQTIKILISDLNVVSQSLKSGEPVDEDFVPAANPRVSPIFLMSQGLHGRDSELTVLKSCYNRTEERGFQFIFCLGEPGSGKTRLINELERTSISRNTFFCVSKYDPYLRGSPFYSIVTVLKDVVHQILSGSVLSITQWRDNIITNLKVDLGVLFDHIPELKDLLGHDYVKLLPRPKRLGPVPRELRFKYVVKSLFSLFGGYGLTIFLDDIQWCPQTELGLFRELATFTTENRPADIHITFVCASTLENKRYQELVRLSKDLNLYHEEIRLSPLSYDAVEEIICNTLTVKSSSSRRFTKCFKKNDLILSTLSAASYETVDLQVTSLAQIVYKVTNGNPLFVNLLLKYMQELNYIYYDKSNRVTGGKWKVNFELFDIKDIPFSVTDVVIITVKSLPPRTFNILKYAACICSNSFTLEDLAVSANVSFSEAANALHHALNFQLILPTTIHYKFPFRDPVGTTNVELYDEEVRRVAAASTYRFYHDLVQQAVYSLIEEDEALETHRLIGMRLLGSDPSKPQTTYKIIEIASQLKNAIPIVTEKERSIFINLNIRAGDEVYAMSDFDMAYRYFDTARRLLPDDYADSQPEFARHIFLTLVELQYNRKNYTACLELIEESLPKFPASIDKAALLRTKTKAEHGLGKSSQAISTGIQALKLLGVCLEESEDWNKDHHAMLRHSIPLSVSEIRELINKKPCEDPVIILVQEIISIMIVPLILSSRPYMFRSLIYTSVLAFLDYGPTASCAFSLLSLASLFQRTGDENNLMRAYEYSKLAILTLENDSAVGLDFGINIYEYYALTLATYFEPMSEVIRYYDLVLSSGQTFEHHSGMLSLSYDLRPICKFLAGEPLSKVHEYFKHMRPVFIDQKDETGNLWIQLHSQGMANFISTGNADTSNLQGQYLSKSSCAMIIESSNKELRYAYYVVKLCLAVIHRHKYVAGDIISNHLPSLIEGVPITIYHVLVTFFGALAIIDMDSPSEKEEEMLHHFARDLEDWSKSNPTMFYNKHLLIKAEMMKNSVNSIITLDTYEEAIRISLDWGLVHEAAIINERCGDYLQIHSKKRSLAYLKESCRLYTVWGAHNRVSQLTTKYPELRTSQIYEIPRMNQSSVEPSVENMSRQNRNLGTGNPSSSNTLSSNPIGVNGNNKSYVTQNSSPLRWILSNLFREDSTEKEQLETFQQLSITGQENEFAVSCGSNERGSKLGDSGTEMKMALQACLEISEAIEMDSVIMKLVQSVMKTSGADYCVFISVDEDTELYVDAVAMLNGISMTNHVSLYTRTDAPLSVVYQVISSGTSVSNQADPRQFDTIYGRDHYFQNRRSQSILCMPIQNQIKTVGVLYLEHQSLPAIFNQARIELLDLYCMQAAVSLEKARLYHQMDLAKKAAEDATAEKASFLANMSHEIRTPFNALLSCSVFLLDTTLSEVQREYVEIIRSSAMLTLNIIDAILAFSKIEHGSITLDNSPFSLRECVESAIQLVAEPAATKDLELVHLNKCGEIDIIYGDVTRVRQIIINLVGNAVKFTSKGHIVVETHAEKVSSDNRYEFVISVKDTGIGIPKNAKNKIFRAFSQVDGSSRRVYGGSGLGLAISKKLAELMGGSLSFESDDNQGTTFWFDLVAVAKIVKEPFLSHMLYKGKKCLVADHHETAREALQTELERLGFEVDLCTKDQVIDIVRDKPEGFYSLVFIDAKLMSLECEESINIKKYSKQTQIIYLTIFGSSLPPDSDKKGISAILMRPAQRSRLTQIVKSILHPSWNASEQVESATKTQDKGIISSLAIQHPLKILLAEDNPINTRVALQHLKRMGYQADHAKDGVEVLAKCANEIEKGEPMYDCVLMDIQMPRKDGIAAAQELNELYSETSNVRDSQGFRVLAPSIIALTANAVGEDRQKCLNSGMINYIAKPILPADLAAVLMGVVPLKERRRNF